MPVVTLSPLAINHDKLMELVFSYTQDNHGSSFHAIYIPPN